MANPTPKSPQIEDFLNTLFPRREAIISDTCAICGGDAHEFRDELSRKEYRISGLCQNCQDVTFVEDDEY